MFVCAVVQALAISDAVVERLALGDDARTLGTWALSPLASSTRRWIHRLGAPRSIRRHAAVALAADRLDVASKQAGLARAELHDAKVGYEVAKVSAHGTAHTISRNPYTAHPHSRCRSPLNDFEHARAGWTMGWPREA